MERWPLILIVIAPVLLRWLCGVIAWLIAERRGFTSWIPWVVSGFLLGPFTILIAAVVPPPDEMEQLETEPRSGSRPRCQSCGQPNVATADRCHRCGAAL